MSALTYRERPADGRRPPACSSSTTAAAPTSTTCSASPTSLDPRAAAARRHAARAADAARLAGLPLVRRAARRLPRPGHVPRRLRAARRVPRRAVGADRRSRPEQTVFGGFSMGSVMSYALGLGARPAGAGGHPRLLRASSRSSTAGSPTSRARPDLRAFIAHGRRDPVMEVGFARRASELLEAGGLDVEYHESDAAPPHRPGARPGRGRLARPHARAGPAVTGADAR